MRRKLLTLPLVFAAACTVEAPREPAPEPIPEPTHLGGCILLSPDGDVPADLYAASAIERTDAYPPFTKRLVVRGLTLVARDDASDGFMEKVATAIRETFPRDESLDLDSQAEILRNHFRYRAVIPVPLGRDMSFLDDDEALRAHLTGENSVCDIIMEGVDGQVMEVVEHILHYVTDIGLHYAFPEEWAISETSALAVAMTKAIDEGYYDISGYTDLVDENERHRILLQEFAYWFVSTAWDLQEAYGPNEVEWTIRSPEELKAKLPEFYAVYERTAARTMAAPSLQTLRDIGPTRAEEAGN